MFLLAGVSLCRREFAKPIIDFIRMVGLKIYWNMKIYGFPTQIKTLYVDRLSGGGFKEKKSQEFSFSYSMRCFYANMLIASLKENKQINAI